MKIIDFDRKGNVVRFFLGNDDCTDYWGDDWDDAPYDCNAGEVYDEYVVAYRDIAFPYGYCVLEPQDDGYYQRPYWSKEDMKQRKIPCVIAVPPDMHDKWSLSYYSDFAGDDRPGIIKYYFGDMMVPSSYKDTDKGDTINGSVFEPC